MVHLISLFTKHSKPFFLVLACALVSSCITYTMPLEEDPLVNPASEPADQKPAGDSGFLALSVIYDFADLYTTPELQFDVINSETKQAYHLHALVQKPDVGQKTISFPLVYRLPIGSYEVDKFIVRLRGTIGKGDMTGADLNVDVSEHFAMVDLKKDQFIHMSTITYKFSESKRGNQISVKVNYGMSHERPSLKTWSTFHTLIEKSQAVYMVRYENVGWKPVPLKWDDKAKDPVK